MDHERLKDQLYALYDGELDESAKRNILDHLSDCVECRQTYERWSKTAKALFPPRKIETSEFFVRQVMDRVTSLEQPKKGFGWQVSLPWLVPALGLAMIILVVAPPASSQAMDDEFIFSNNTSTADETLQYVMEGGR